MVQNLLHLITPKLVLTAGDDISKGKAGKGVVSWIGQILKLSFLINVNGSTARANKMWPKLSSSSFWEFTL